MLRSFAKFEYKRGNFPTPGIAASLCLGHWPGGQASAVSEKLIIVTEPARRAGSA